jgi:hypothetical protein
VKKHICRASAIIALITATYATNLSGQETHPTVYVESKDEFANDFSAGIVRKNVPVTLTGDRQGAGYVARFTWATNEGSKTRGVMTTLAIGVYMSGSYERVSMSIIERKSKNLVYSYTCQKGGRHMQSVAECLAKHWKDALEGGKVKMQQFTSSDLEGVQDADVEAVSVRKAGDTLAAQITEHPVASSVVPLRDTTASEAQTDSVAEASRHVKAEKAAQKAKLQQLQKSAVRPNPGS